MSKSKAEEARKHLDAAERALKTGFLKWTPEFDVAAAEFEKAGLNFKLAKQFKEAIDAYRRAAECHAHPKCTSTPFHAGKALETAAQCAKELKDPKLSVELIQQAAQYYRRTGKNSSACTALEKAALQCDQSGDYAAALQLWKDIYELFDEEGKPRQCKRPLERAVASAVKGKDFKEAITLLEKQSKLLDDTGSKSFVFQSILSQVVILLHMGDFNAADHAFSHAGIEFDGFGPSEEGRLAARLLEAFETASEEELQAVKKDHIFTFLLPDVTILVRGLRLQGGAQAVSRSSAKLEGDADLRSQLFAAPSQPKSPSHLPSPHQEASAPPPTQMEAPSPPPYSPTDPNAPAVERKPSVQADDMAEVPPTFQDALDLNKGSSQPTETEVPPPSVEAGDNDNEDEAAKKEEAQVSPAANDHDDSNQQPEMQDDEGPDYDEDDIL